MDPLTKLESQMQNEMYKQIPLQVKILEHKRSYHQKLALSISYQTKSQLRNLILISEQKIRRYCLMVLTLKIFHGAFVAKTVQKK